MRDEDASGTRRNLRHVECVKDLRSDLKPSWPIYVVQVQFDQRHFLYGCAYWSMWDEDVSETFLMHVKDLRSALEPSPLSYVVQVQFDQRHGLH